MFDELTRSETLLLFKMYEDKGWAVKQQVNNMVVWLTPIVFGLLAFSAKENCSQLASPSGTARLASVTAIFLSIFLSVLVFGSVKHADRDYRKADEVMKKNRYLLPNAMFHTILHSPKPIVPRLGMPTIGGVHIGLVYWSFLLVVLSIAVLLVPVAFWAWVCGDAGRQLDLIGWDVS
jgi:hypothetical protein